MAYPKRDWANTGNEVTKDDFKRIENGIEANDLEITKQKNPTIPGTLAKQIADNVTAIEENANKINDCLQYRGVITSMSQINKDGYYYINLGDSTFPYPYGILKIESGGGEKVATYDTTGSDKKTYKNVKTSGASWGVWQPIATTTKGALILQNQWVNHSSELTAGYSKSGSIVTCSGRIKNGSTTQYAPIFKLPFEVDTTYNGHICQLYQADGNVIGSGIVSYGNFVIVTVSQTIDVNFNFSYITTGV